MMDDILEIRKVRVQKFIDALLLAEKTKTDELFMEEFETLVDDLNHYIKTKEDETRVQNNAWKF